LAILYSFIFYSYENNYLFSLFRSLCQGGQKLPEGPLLLNPGSAIEAFRQVGCLRNFRATNQTKRRAPLVELGEDLEGLYGKRTALFCCRLIVGLSKYEHIHTNQHAVSVPTSELGPPTPSLASEGVSPPPPTKGGKHSPACEGWGSINSDD
jgi:hypothetical protein